MSVTLAKLIVLVGSDTDQATKGLDGVNQKLQASGDIGKTALGVFSGVVMQRAVSGIVSLAKGGLDAYASYERLGMSLNTLSAREAVVTGQSDNMGDALLQTKTRAEELVSTIEEMAILSPFRQDSIAATMQTAMGYGMASDVAVELTQALVDLASATGREESDMQRLGLALGQVWAKGKLAGQEMLQLTNAGIGYADVARAMGIRTEDLADAISAGKVKAEELIPALIEIINLDFGGEAERQSTSWAGLLSTFEDIRDVNIREFLSATLEAVQPLAEQLADTFGSPEFREEVRETGEQFAETLSILISYGQSLSSTWSSIPVSVRELAVALGGIVLIGPNVLTMFGGISKGLSGIAASASETVRAFRAGLSVKTALEVGFGATAISIAAVGAAIVTVTAAIREFQNTQKIIDDGNQKAADGWNDYINGLTSGGTSATQVMDGIISKQMELNRIFEEGGIVTSIVAQAMGADIAPSIEKVSKAIQASSGSYEEYVTQMMRYHAEMGGLGEMRAEGVRDIILEGNAIESLYEQYGILTPEMYTAADAERKHADAATVAKERLLAYEKASHQVTASQEEQNSILLETADILSIVNSTMSTFPESLALSEETVTAMNIALGEMSEANLQLEDDIRLLTEGFAYGIVPQERWTEGLLAAKTGVDVLSDSERLALDNAVGLRDAQINSSKAAADAAASYWDLAESLKGASNAEIAKTLIDELGMALDEGTLLPEQYGAAVGELQEAFGISDEKSRALAAGIPLLTEAFNNNLIPATNMDEALKFLIEDAGDGVIEFGKLLEEFGTMPDEMQPGIDSAGKMSNAVGGDVYDAFMKAATARSEFEEGLKDLYEWAKNNPIQVDVVWPTIPGYGSSGTGDTPYVPPSTGGGSGGKSGTGSGSPPLVSTSFGQGETVIINQYNYNQQATAISNAELERLRRQRNSGVMGVM